MLTHLTNGDFNGVIIIAIVLIVSLALHEFGHAAAADLQGDPTPRLAGRLTLNPIRHLDPFGTVMLVLVGFGWGKPVPISPPNLRNRRFGSALVAIAGPTMNVILAFTGAAVAKFLKLPVLIGLFPYPGFTVFDRFVSAFIYLNVLLAVLNLIPIPPLDGSRILSAVLPPNKQHIIYFLDQWGFLILLVAALFVLPNILGPATASVERFFLRLVGY